MSKKKFLIIIIGMIIVALAVLVFVISTQKKSSPSCPGPNCFWNKCIKDSSGNEHCPI